MALSHSWSTTVKVALPLLVVMAMAIAPRICGAQVEHDVVEMGEAAPLAKAGRGRFLSNYAGSSNGRRLLNFNLCGPGGSPPNYDCTSKFPFFKNAQCCTDKNNVKTCFDVGAYLLDKCGSCNTLCPFPQICCLGVCTNVQSNDRNNCGACGIVCKNNLPCQNGLCGYGIFGAPK